MPIDPQIALETRLPQIQSPLQTLGNAALMGDRQAMQQERMEQAEQKRRALEDDNAIRAALQANPNDPDAAIQSLYGQGRASAAGSLSKNLLQTRNEEADALAKVVKGHKDTLDFVTDALAGVSDQQSLDSWRSMAQPLLEKNGLGNVISLVPTQYDQKSLDRVLQMGTGAKKKLDNEKLAIDNLKATNENTYASTKNADEHAKAVAERRAQDYKVAGSVLGATTNQQDLDQKQRLLASQGVSTDVLAAFGNQWSPQYGANAQKLGSTPAEQQAAAHNKVEETQGAERVQNERDRLNFEKGGGAAASRPLTADARAAAERAKYNAYAKLDTDSQKAVAADKQSLQDVLNSPKATPAAKADAQKQLDTIEQQRVAGMASKKLAIENSYRAQIGLPSLEDAEASYKAAGADKELRTIRNKYRLVTGQPAPIEAMEQLATKIKSEKDPKKKAALVDQLKKQRAAYGSGPASPPPAAQDDSSKDDDEQ